MAETTVIDWSRQSLESKKRWQVLAWRSAEGENKRIKGCSRRPTSRSTSQGETLTWFSPGRARSSANMNGLSRRSIQRWSKARGEWRDYLRMRAVGRRSTRKSSWRSGEWCKPLWWSELKWFERNCEGSRVFK